MTNASQGPAAQPNAGAKRRGHASRFLKEALGFWKGEDRRKAWFLTISFVTLLLLNVGVALAVNRWNKYFFDALERKDVEALTYGVGLVLALALMSAAAAVAIIHVRMRLQLYWRRWLVSRLIARWISERRFYQLSIVGGSAENPEARISEDVRLSTDLLVDFSGGVVNAVISAVSFIAVLWVVGGSITVGGVTIPGYLVIACIVYSTLSTLGMYLLGKPLVARVEDKAAGEAQFRYELTRVKDSAENIALIGGDEDEKQKLGATFQQLIERWLGVISRQGLMTWLTGSNLVLSPVIPLLLGAPSYLSGAMTLGSLMQAAAAFVSVQNSLNWLADNALRLADWFASAQRVAELDEALDQLDSALGDATPDRQITIAPSPDDSIHFKDLNVTQHDGKLMIEEAGSTIGPGEKVLVKGFSGSGKSTLIRAMAGLWPWGSGQILLPENAKVAFIPQKPYFPLGTLRDALLYPESDRPVEQAEIEATLVRCGLEHLIPDLDEEKEWSTVLSGGEQQRLAFARALLNPPDILIMDEPTSALDELSQFKLLEYMRDDLAKTTVIHVGHRPGMEQFHNREINLVRAESGAATPEDRDYGLVGEVMWRLSRWLR